MLLPFHSFFEVSAFARALSEEQMFIFAAVNCVLLAILDNGLTPLAIHLQHYVQSEYRFIPAPFSSFIERYEILAEIQCATFSSKRITFTAVKKTNFLPLFSFVPTG